MATLAATCTREEILGCFSQYMDMDGDGYLNVTEVNHFMLYDPCESRPPLVVGESFISMCDKNGDGLLSVEDYDHANSCMNILGLARVVCDECKTCNEMHS